MELSKYPITHNGNKYRVDIIKDHVAFDHYQWEAVVYEFILKTLPFGLKKYVWKKVYTHSTGWSNYNKWVGNFIDLAKLGVTVYEKSVKNEEDMKNNEKQGIKKWNEWDGVIK